MRSREEGDCGRESRVVSYGAAAGEAVGAAGDAGGT